ncbi:hypothetical protein NDU88_005632 [Pleurodeles waltl]|uniref:Uncharacterized protein n=1 Tax=Pleurodeles waltl TaxID=8319 RepID=A0AAV7LQ33_PLEWA|nr:hypothetical protein NDU88_005632 [Pleurodeles waltl]
MVAVMAGAPAEPGRRHECELMLGWGPGRKVPARAPQPEVSRSRLKALLLDLSLASNRRIDRELADVDDAGFRAHGCSGRGDGEDILRPIRIHPALASTPLVP